MGRKTSLLITANSCSGILPARLLSHLVYQQFFNLSWSCLFLFLTCPVLSLVWNLLSRRYIEFYRSSLPKAGNTDAGGGGFSAESSGTIDPKRCRQCSHRLQNHVYPSALQPLSIASLWLLSIALNIFLRSPCFSFPSKFHGKLCAVKTVLREIFLFWWPSLCKSTHNPLTTSLKSINRMFNKIFLLYLFNNLYI